MKRNWDKLTSSLSAQLEQSKANQRLTILQTHVEAAATYRNRLKKARLETEKKKTKISEKTA